MNPLWTKWLRRTLFVGGALACVGYGFAKAFLWAHHTYAGDSYNVENERVLWQTPLIMAGLGMVFSGGIEAMVMLYRKPLPVSTPTPPRSGSSS